MDIVVAISVFAVVIVAHEFSHAWAAYCLGDDTARKAGRLTLNPIAHLDMVGTVMLPALLILSRSPVVFGWAKPVPVNPLNFKNPRLGLFLSSAAGPASNFILAALFVFALKSGYLPPKSLPWLFALEGALISLVLGFFNLIPIPPLDGANMLLSLLPRRMLELFSSVERYGFIILIVLLYAGLLDRIIIPAVRFTMGFLAG